MSNRKKRRMILWSWIMLIHHKYGSPPAPQYYTDVLNDVYTDPVGEGYTD